MKLKLLEMLIVPTCLRYKSAYVIPYLAQKRRRMYTTMDNNLGADDDSLAL